MLGLAAGCGEQKFVAVNAEPDVIITSHDNGDEVGEGMRTWFRAVADDADDVEDELVATWTAGTRIVCEAVPVSDFGETICEIQLTDDEFEVAVYVEDPRGSNGGDAVRLDVQLTDAPSVELLSPGIAGVNYYVDHSVLLEARAFDAEDRAELLTVAWNSDVDGVLESPSAPDDDGMVRSYVGLSQGEHLVRVSVTDTTDKTGTDVISIVVQGPNTPPECAWIAPMDSTVLVTGEPVVLTGTASDADVPADWLMVTWSSNRDEDGVLDTVSPTSIDGVVGGSGEASITVSDLSVGEHTLTMTVSDEMGLTCSVDRLVVVTSRPNATILRPMGEAIYYADHPVFLEGLAQDLEDGSDVLVARWGSDLDGELEVPISVDADDVTSGFVSLQSGSHVISLEVTDADGVTGADSSSIVVRGPNQPPTCVVTGPAPGTGGDAATLMTFTGTVGDEDVGPEALTVTWSSDLMPFGDTLGTSTPSSDGTVSLATSALDEGTHRVTMTVTDEVGATCVDGTTVVVGFAPSVDITAPADDSVVNVGTTVVFMAMVSDPDESATDLLVEWSSDRDGVLWTDAPDSVGFTTFSSNELTIGTHTIRLTVTDSLGLYTVDVAVFRVNGLPTAPVVRITPEFARTTDTLGVVIDTPSVDPDPDPDGGAIVYQYEWSRDLDLVGTSSTVSASETAKHQVWTVRVTPYDGHGLGVGGLASRTIENTVPVIAEVEIGPSPLFTDDVAASTVTVFDPDEEDVVALLHAWTVDETLVAETDVTLDGAVWFSKHQEVGLSVTPSDAESTGDSVSAPSVFVDNAPPTAPEVIITPDPVMVGVEPMQCRIDEPGFDADGDEVLYSIVWTRDSDPYPEEAEEDPALEWVGPLTDDWTGDTVPAGDTVVDEEWTCAVTSWDEEEEGGRAEVSIVVQPLPPGCGDGILQDGEEIDPPPGPFLELSADSDTCRWDFSMVEQLYCYGECSWGGELGCDQADADILCKLVTDNPDAVALSYDLISPWTGPGFGSPTCDIGERIDVNGRGVIDVSWMDVSLASHFGAGGQVVAFPDCTDP
jgi:hypothetical protein